MILEGLKLTCLGIGVVYLFLGLLVAVIKLTSRLLRPFTAREEAIYLAVPAKKQIPQRKPDDQQQRLMAVISAAIAAHRAKNGLPTPSPIPPQTAGQPGVIQPAALRYQGGPGPKDAAGSRPSLARLLFRDLSLFRGFGQHSRRRPRT